MKIAVSLFVVGLLALIVGYFFGVPTAVVTTAIIWLGQVVVAIIKATSQSTTKAP